MKSAKGVSSPAFLAVSVILLVSAVFFNTTVVHMKLHFKKDPVPQPRSFSSLPPVMGRWLQVSQDEPLDRELEDSLGTKQYLYRDFIRVEHCGGDLVAYCQHLKDKPDDKTFDLNREETIDDAALVQHLDRAGVQTSGPRAFELDAGASLDDEDIGPRQRQLRRQHHPRWTSSGNHHSMLGHTHFAPPNSVGSGLRRAIMRHGPRLHEGLVCGINWKWRGAACGLADGLPRRTYGRQDVERPAGRPRVGAGDAPRGAEDPIGVHEETVLV